MDETRTEHYLQLISSASQDIYPQNVTAEFTTHLAHPLRLTGRWEVGLHSCSYHRNWVNLNNEEDAKFNVRIAKDVGNMGQNAPRLFAIVDQEFILPWPANYSSPKSIIDALLDTYIFPNFNDMPAGTPKSMRDDLPYTTLRGFLNISFNTATQKFRIWMPEEDKKLRTWAVELRLSPRIAFMLGHYDNEGMLTIPLAHNHLKKMADTAEYYEGAHGHYVFPTPAALQEVFNIFLYTDCVRNSYLGDADSEYLYMVPVQGQEGDYIHHQVHKIVYKEVDTELINSIHIQVADQFSQRVQFNYGSGDFTCLIHFRKVA